MSGTYLPLYMSQLSGAAEAMTPFTINTKFIWLGQTRREYDCLDYNHLDLPITLAHIPTVPNKTTVPGSFVCTSACCQWQSLLAIYPGLKCILFVLETCLLSNIGRAAAVGFIFRDECMKNYAPTFDVRTPLLQQIYQFFIL